MLPHRIFRLRGQSVGVGEAHRGGAEECVVVEPVSDPAHPRPFHRLDYGQMLQGVLGAFTEPRLDADPTGDHTK